MLDGYPEIPTDPGTEAMLNQLHTSDFHSITGSDNEMIIENAINGTVDITYVRRSNIIPEMQPYLAH